MGRIWKKMASRLLAQYRIFNLREDIYVNPRTNLEFPAFVLETHDWINIIPITVDNKVVMVKQFRFASEEVTLEIPGGLVDAEDESLVRAAERELIEETGYIASNWQPLGCVRPNPAILNNKCHVFWAQGCVETHPQALDEGEDILVDLVPLEQIPELILDGTINHSIVLNAFHLLDITQRVGDRK